VKGTENAHNFLWESAPKLHAYVHDLNEPENQNREVILKTVPNDGIPEGTYRGAVKQYAKLFEYSETAIYCFRQGVLKKNNRHGKTVDAEASIKYDLLGDYRN
jgi:hypothetical protein